MIKSKKQKPKSKKIKKVALPGCAAHIVLQNVKQHNSPFKPSSI